MSWNFIPSTVLCPEVGAVSAQSMRIVVDFPAPFGPRNPVTRPGLQSNVMSSTTLREPYRLVRFSAVIMSSSVVSRGAEGIDPGYLRRPPLVVAAARDPTGSERWALPYADDVTFMPLPAYPEHPISVEETEPGDGRWRAAWSRLWRYCITILTGFLFLLVLPADLWGLPEEAAASDALERFLLLDAAFGFASLCLLPLRHRFPTAVASVTAASSAVSAFALAPAMWAATSMSTRRRWSRVVAVGLIWAAATLYYEGILRPSAGASEPHPAPVTSGGLVLAVYAICVATGFYVGARRALLTSLHDRAENAEREQAMRAESAREGERARIAREMHDVLAHRISLIALHAGAMTYRANLSRDETYAAATVIQDNAKLALSELRQVLGVLRGGHEHSESGRPEPAQPTLADLPALLREAREAGMTVTLDAADSAGALSTPPHGPADDMVAAHAQRDPSKTVSRTAYRIIQEGLTNARKHEPVAPVQLRLDHTDGFLRVEMRNATTKKIDEAREAGRGIHGIDMPWAENVGSGVGLIGLRERAQLAGGRIEHGLQRDGSFLLRAWLPWR
jgi:signal transduction histidine kinase